MPRILIIKLSAIGDCLLASPVAQALRDSFPEAHIGWVVHPHCSPVVAKNPYLDRVHLWPRKQLFRHVLRVAKEIRAEHYDIAIDLQGLFKSGLIAKLSGAKRRIGPVEAREGAHVFYTETVARNNKVMHVVPGYLELARAAGASWTEEPPMHMPFGEEELQIVQTLLAPTCLNGPAVEAATPDSNVSSNPQARAMSLHSEPDGSTQSPNPQSPNPDPRSPIPATLDPRPPRPATSNPIIVLNPSAGKAIKQWGPERFGSLGDRLIEERHACIVITGAPSDRALADAVLAAMKHRDQVLDLTGKTNLNQLAALLSQVDLFIGGDTGPMHIAQAAGTKVLALFGPTDPKTLGPRRDIHRVATLNLECSPCRHRECPIGRLCLENLEVGLVFGLSTEMLAESGL